MAANDQTKNQKNFLVSLKEMASISFTEELEPKEELRQEISRISEAGYYAGWNVDIEFFLWQAVLGGSREFGATTITQEEIVHLKTLSEQSGGWWHWRDESAEALFVTLDEWQKVYQSFGER